MTPLTAATPSDHPSAATTTGTVVPDSAGLGIVASAPVVGFATGGASSHAAAQSSSTFVPPVAVPEIFEDEHFLPPADAAARIENEQGIVGDEKEKEKAFPFGLPEIFPESAPPDDEAAFVAAAMMRDTAREDEKKPASAAVRLDQRDAAEKRKAMGGSKSIPDNRRAAAGAVAMQHEDPRLLEKTKKSPPVAAFASAVPEIFKGDDLLPPAHDAAARLEQSDTAREDKKKPASAVPEIFKGEDQLPPAHDAAARLEQRDAAEKKKAMGGSKSIPDNRRAATAAVAMQLEDPRLLEKTKKSPPVAPSIDGAGVVPDDGTPVDRRTARANDGRAKGDVGTSAEAEASISSRRGGEIAPFSRDEEERIGAVFGAEGLRMEEPGNHHSESMVTDVAVMQDEVPEGEISPVVESFTENLPTAIPIEEEAYLVYESVFVEPNNRPWWKLGKKCIGAFFVIIIALVVIVALFLTSGGDDEIIAPASASAPTFSPTNSTSEPSLLASSVPSLLPTIVRTNTPSLLPSSVPSDVLTTAPSQVPTASPTIARPYEIMRELETEVLPEGVRFSDLNSTNPRSRALEWIISIDRRKLMPGDKSLRQRYVLMLLKESMMIVPGGFWMTGLDECFWGRVTCSNNNITGLTLGGIPSVGSLGSIPPEISRLGSLGDLDLSGNKLVGSLPSELGRLLYLAKFNLHGNDLTGTIPTEFGLLASKAAQVWHSNVLDMSSNKLRGDIPTELGLSIHLRFLILYDNYLNGTIPTELGSMTNLTYIHVGDNQLSGKIPTELGLLTNLKQIYLYENMLNGTIPTEFGLLENLEALWLYGNNFSGSVPQEVCALLEGNLRKLWVRNRDNENIECNCCVQ